MRFLQQILMLFIILLINNSNTFEVNIESSSTTTTIQPIHERVAAEIFKIQNDLKNDEEQLKIDRHKLDEEKKIIRKYIKKTDVIRLNVGGEIFMTTRQTLTHAPKSIFSIMFNGRWELRMEVDKNDNIFLDFNPNIFRHLLDQLQLFDTENNFHRISLPPDPSLVIPFKKMIEKLGLNELLSSEKNIINFNIGGQRMTSRRTTFTEISNSTFDSIFSSSNITKFNNKSDIFVDYNPKLFQYLINHLREGLPKNKSYWKSLSYQENIFFKRMLVNLKIFRSLSIPKISATARWIQNGITVAGGNGLGSGLNQLYHPYGIYVDDNQTIYVTDCNNHRIVEWKNGATTGQVVAGGNGQGNLTDQLSKPWNVIVDKENAYLIISDYGNKRVVRWSRQNGTNGETIISNVDCTGLAIDNNGHLYVSDVSKHEVRRWKIGETEGTLVAGGNSQGNGLNQLHYPEYIFVDEDQSVYVSDYSNYRVMKWLKGAKEGILVAGSQGQGNGLIQLSSPLGIIVDQLGTVYIADYQNHRVMRWLKGAKEGSVVVGGNGQGGQANQLNYPRDLSFDGQNNLYVVDDNNHRVQKFNIEQN